MRNLLFFQTIFRRYSKSLISIIFLNLISQLALTQTSLKKQIHRAIDNTYCNGELSYDLLYRQLTSTNDTLSDTISVNLINNTKEFSFSAQHRDSLVEVYYQNLLLLGNLKLSEYELNKMDKEDVFFEIDHLFQPMVDNEFSDILLSDSNLIETISENDQTLSCKITIMDPGDLSSLFYNLLISKQTKSVKEYNLNASVGGVSIWQSWKVLDSKKEHYNSDKMSVNGLHFFNYLSILHPKKINNNSDTLKLKKDNDTVKIIDALPLINLISLKNDTIKMSEFTSQFYLVDFWFRSCFPCIKSLPVLKELHEMYDENKLHIISINNVDKNKELIDKFITDNGIPYDVFTESVEYGNKFNGIHIYPTFVIYDKYFNILKKIEGYSDSLKQNIIDILDSKN